MNREDLKLIRDDDPAPSWVSPRIVPLNSGSDGGLFYKLLARKLIETSIDAFFLIDSETGLILECNRKAEELLKEPAGAIAGRPYARIPLVPMEGSTNATETGKPADVRLGRFEAMLQLKDGSSLPVEVTADSFRVMDRGFIRSVLHDISDRKRTESMLSEAEKGLRHLQKMEAVGTLAGGIAHEFNNILATILGYTEMSYQDTSDQKELLRNLDHILAASLRARDLIKQILTFSRSTEQEALPLRLDPIIKETVQMLRATLPKDIEIKQNIKKDVGTVRADPIQIHQALLNLCTNAANAMNASGGTLTVELSPAALEENEIARLSGRFPGLSPGAFLLLSVADTGCGMEPELLDRIFDPFFTTRPFGDHSGKGLAGMGLAVVHGIIKKHAGAITVESKPGVGSIFKIYLPLLEETQPKHSLPLQNMPDGKERILFIDDEEPLTLLAGKMLRRLGYHVVTQTNSLDALKIFGSRPEAFDLVITDQSMPHLSGFMLTRELRMLRRDIPVILCTGFNEANLPEDFRAAGIDELIQKPLVMREIAAVIRRVLDSNR